MTLTDEQYERVARHLDGEEVALSAAERAVAEEIRREQRCIGELLDVSPPAESIARAHEHVLIEDIRRDEAALAPLLDAHVPRETIQRTHSRVVAALARPQRMLMRIGTAAATLAAAAAVLLAIGLWSTWSGGGGSVETPPVPVAQRPVPIEILAASIQGPETVELDLLAEEIDRLEADVLAAAPPAPVDLGMDQVQQALEEFWLDDMDLFE